MKMNPVIVSGLLALAAAGLFTATPALAAQPAWAGGGGKHGGHEKKDEHHKGEHHGKEDKHFDDKGRVAVREYFESEYRGGNCPPGLAKKHNGCMPPGQAKKWSMGQPLATDVVTYDLPPELVVRIGVPPVGYKYVRVANDILMIAAGTNMVVDAINDLGR